MSKTYSKEKLQEMAKPVFESNPNVDSLLATRDGQFFIPQKACAAQNHARLKGGLEIYKIQKESAKGQDKIAEKTPQKAVDAMQVKAKQ